MDRRKLAIGFVLYGESTTKYLGDFLPSLIASAANCGLDTVIMAFDNGPENFTASRDFLRDYDQVVLLGGGRNLGFAGANNQLIAAASEAGANYFLTINPDTLLEVDSLKELLRPMENNISLAAVSPKLRRWDFATKIKTGLLDTCGIVVGTGLQFHDLGQGEVDRGQYDEAAIAGPSGAAALYRISALARVKDEHGYFDERFFMYKEDCDLTYRLRLLNLPSALAPLSIIYHDRSAATDKFNLLTRFKGVLTKKPQILAWSYYGDWLMIFKHWSGLALTDKLAVSWYRFLSLAYALVFNRELFTEIKRAKRSSVSSRPAGEIA